MDSTAWKSNNKSLQLQEIEGAEQAKPALTTEIVIAQPSSYKETFFKTINSKLRYKKCSWSIWSTENTKQRIALSNMKQLSGN